MHPNLLKLAECRNAREAIQAGLIHCGFEFEYHGFREVLPETPEETRPELPRYKQILRAMNHLIVNGGTIEPETITYQGRTFDTPLSYVNAVLLEQPSLRYEDARQSNQGFDAVRNSTLFPKLNGLAMELGTDGSVRGGEIRTLGACTPRQFMAAARELFASNHVWEVDEGCSFHIHLSVPEVKHSFGYQTQYRLLEGLALNASSVPKRVISRWKNQGTYNYYRVHLSREKYSFVHFHDQGTWEFRCWGNISSYRDALRCLLLSIEALIHATYCRVNKVPNMAFRTTEVPVWVADYAGEGYDDSGEGNDQLCELWSALVGIGGPVDMHQGVI